MSEKKETIRTLFISDIHMGLSFAQPTKLYQILDYYKVKNIYFIGDSINSSKLENKQQELLNTLLTKTDKTTKLYFLQGNHDKELHYNGSFSKEIIYTTLKQKKYILLHGDLFDETQPEKSIFLKILGESVYFVALHLNNFIFFLYKYCPFFKPFLMTKVIKDHSSLITKHIQQFKKFLTSYAKEKKLNGVICGHIHYPEDEIIDNIHYLNCGDWIENFSFVIEDFKGDLKLLNYYDLYPLTSKNKLC